MSDYEKRYEVHARQSSHYTDDEAEAVKWLDSDPEHGWCNEGYADEEYIGPGHREYGGIEGTMYTRRQIGPLTRHQLLARITDALLARSAAQREES
jgi:hypothetical protein